MTFAEDHARLLLLLHTGLAVAAVAASTHLVLWLRKIARGQHGRLAAARRFALWAALLHAGAFVAGNLMYPTYKVHVKAAFLQHPGAVAADAEARAARLTETVQRYVDRDAPPVAPATERADTTEKIARWFDSKEHWVALGLPLSLALAFLLPAWRPEPGAGAEVLPFVRLLALAACASLWLGTIIGVLVASYRAVGG